jgi:acetyl-CoA carboxylase biotin carboxyl carrier protein
VNIEQIKELIEILENSKLNKLSFKDEKGCELSLEKAENQHPFFPTHLHQGYHTTPPATPHVVQTAKHEEVTSSYITAPMVGTCYLTQAPGEPAFVKVGDTVTENSLVCIIEAMKVMNPIPSPKAGIVREIMVADGHPVEFGEPLLVLE